MNTFVDVHGFAGAFTLGMVQAGFKLLGKREGPEGFGVENCEANRHLLGYDWKTQSIEPRLWAPIKVDVVAGNPPCSGFSSFSPSSFRGVDSPANKCMWDLINYAAKCDPQVVIFESVQPAYKMGRPLMRDLRARLELLTNHKYTLYHVLHNAASVGGGALRKRYFFLASRIPFGIEYPIIKAVPSLFEVIGDLRGLNLTFNSQPYLHELSWWAKKLHNPEGTVDGHCLAYSGQVQRIMDLMKEVPWNIGESMVAVAKKYYEKLGGLPESFPHNTIERYQKRSWDMGFQPTRWNYYKAGHVVMGNGPHTIVHPQEARTMTFREIARILGYPDNWTLKQCYGNRKAPAWLGKGISVQCGSWVGKWIKRAFENNPGSYQGHQLDSNEYLINVTYTYKNFPGAHQNA